MQRDRLPYLLLPAAALLAVLPLILHGCSCGHDFDFHLISWLEAARQFTHGTLHPRWAYTPAWNAGEPRFVFYPPLSWTIGALLTLILPIAWAPIAFTWLALALSGLTLHRLARTFASPSAALLAAVFYTLNPYMLFTAYERTAYAELLAAAWIPLLLHAILRPNSHGGVTLPRIAVPVALLWLTNAPAAVMGCYALALLTLLRLLQSPEQSNSPSTRPATHPKFHLALTTTFGALLGLALAAFYLIPAAYERRYVQINMAILQGLRIQDDTLFHHTTAGLTAAALDDAIFHDQVLHTASTIALLLLTLTAITLLLAYRTTTKPANPYLHSELSPSGSSATAPTHPSQRHILLPLTLLTLAIAVALTPLSLPLWNQLPELAFLQFPWRLLVLLAAVLSLTLAITLTRLRLKPLALTLTAATLALALILPAYTLFRQPCDPDDTPQSIAAAFHHHTGSEPTDEYTPLTADNDSLAHANPPYWLSPNPNAPAPTSTQPGPAPTHLTLTTPQPQTLILNLRDYPSWSITRNHSSLPDHLQRDDGLLAIQLPSGTSTIDITRTRLHEETLGLLLTLLALLTLAVLLVRNRIANHA